MTAGTRSTGLAAFKRAESDVRVVHEFLVNRRLDDRDNELVTRLMLGALENPLRSTRVFTAWLSSWVRACRSGRLSSVGIRR